MLTNCLHAICCFRQHIYLFVSLSVCHSSQFIINATFYMIFVFDSLLFHVSNAVVAILFSHLAASSSASFVSPSSNFVNRYMSTMWFIVCWWPQSQMSDVTRPHLCKQARQWALACAKTVQQCPCWRGRSKPGCQIALYSSNTGRWLTTEADNSQSSSHCTMMSTEDCVIPYIGRLW